LAFSIWQRCQGLCGSQKRARRSIRLVTDFCRANSPPLFVVGDRAPRLGGQPTQLCSDGAGRDVGFLAEETPDQCRDGPLWTADGWACGSGPTVHGRRFAVAAHVGSCVERADAAGSRADRRGCSRDGRCTRPTPCATLPPVPYAPRSALGTIPWQGGSRHEHAGVHAGVGSLPFTLCRAPRPRFFTGPRQPSPNPLS
jgi:hypothetical protein